MTGQMNIDPIHLHVKGITLLGFITKTLWFNVIYLNVNNVLLYNVIICNQQLLDV